MPKIKKIIGFIWRVVSFLTITAEDGFKVNCVDINYVTAPWYAYKTSIKTLTSNIVVRTCGLNLAGRVLMEKILRQVNVEVCLHPELPSS